MSARVISRLGGMAALPIGQQPVGAGEELDRVERLRRRLGVAVEQRHPLQQMCAAASGHSEATVVVAVLQRLARGGLARP